jgi:hypothetical protein
MAVSEPPYVDVVEVFETKWYGEANAYLQAGWVMLAAFSTTTDPQIGEAVMRYSVGWPRSRAEAPVHPGRSEPAHPKTRVAE